MGQIRVTGVTAESDLERLMPVDLATLPLHQQRYTLLTNETGGVRDDLMICRHGAADFMLVVNAACKTEDLAYLKCHISADTQITLLEDQALLALQGPASAEVMGKLAPQLLQLKFMQATHCQLAGVDCFEISLPVAGAESLARCLLAFEQVAQRQQVFSVQREFCNK